MKETLRMIRVAWAFFRADVQQFLTDKGNFWSYLVSTALHQLTFLAFISVIFSKVPEIKGWSFHEILFIYGFFTSVTGLFYTFFAWTLWFPELYILHNRLDQILTLPGSPYFLILSEEFGKSVMELLTVIMGISVLFYSGYHLSIVFSLEVLVIMAVSMIAGLMILGGLFTLISALSFWYKSHASFTSPVMNLMEFAQYPVSMYNRWIRLVLTLIIPMSFVGFYPAAAVIRLKDYWFFFPLTLAWGITIFLAGIFVWNLGLKRYESSGNG